MFVKRDVLMHILRLPWSKGKITEKNATLPFLRTSNILTVLFCSLDNLSR